MNELLTGIASCGLAFVLIRLVELLAEMYAQWRGR